MFKALYQNVGTTGTEPQFYGLQRHGPEAK